MYSCEGVMSPAQTFVSRVVEDKVFSNFIDSILSLRDRGALQDEVDINRIFEATITGSLTLTSEDKHVPGEMHEELLENGRKAIDQVRVWTILLMKEGVTKEDYADKVQNICEGVQTLFDQAAQGILEYEAPDLKTDTEPSL